MLQKRVASYVIILLAAAGLWGQSSVPDLLTGEFWTELDPIIKSSGYEYPVSQETAARRLLEEAVFVFSARVYGFEFEYVPMDAARGIPESFSAVFPAKIPWGDRGVKADSIWVEDNLYWARILYRPKEFEMKRMNVFYSSAVHSSQGTGEAPVQDGLEAKSEALRDSLKQAVRNMLRPSVPNKPARITGRALLAEDPYTIIAAGQYRCTARFFITVENVKEYSVR